jgi:hypothetical protein
VAQAVQQFRRRLAERGLKRLEVSVAASDADLLRQVAKLLNSDDPQSERLREAVQGIVPEQSTIKFKDWIKAP